MAKSTKKTTAKAAPIAKKGKTAPAAKKIKTATKKVASKLKRPAALAHAIVQESGASVLDRLFATIASRRDADPAVSHSARLLSRGRAKVAQKFGEEAVECLIEAVAGNRSALIAESADVLYHLLVMWVDTDVAPQDVWLELERRQGVSGIAEKAARAQKLSASSRPRTTKIP
jgi:phosphoribosyl-ATP pyrophosphohydrolase